MVIHKGDALDLITQFDRSPDLIVTDPPYAFGGAVSEHQITSTVAVVLRECARALARDSWMVVYSASSWRSVTYMVDALRGVVEPVRVGSWCKPQVKTRVSPGGWAYSTVIATVFRKGRARSETSQIPDHITEAIVSGGRRATLPDSVASWSVGPWIKPGGLFLDPFAGSGSLCRAAERFGMEAVGFELDPPKDLGESELCNG